MSKAMGVVVVVPSNGRPVPIEWAMAIATLQYPLGMHHAWFINKKAPLNPEFTRSAQREQLAERAVALGAEFMMCLDDDTVPPAHAIQSLWRVLAQNPDAAICGGIYCSKEAVPSPLVWKELGAGPFLQWTLGDIFPCKGLGLGCMMIRLSALKDIPKPWFHDTATSEPGRVERIGELDLNIIGETGTDDLYLCEKMSTAGKVILAHGGVLPMHIGEDGQQFVLPEDSYPVQTYLKKKAEMEAKGLDPRNRESKVRAIE